MCSLNVFVIFIVFVLAVVFLLVMFSHDLPQFCEVTVWSGRLEGFESITANMQKEIQMQMH